MLDREIVEHRSHLKEILGVPINSFSYPYGMPNFILKKLFIQSRNVVTNTQLAAL